MGAKIRWLSNLSNGTRIPRVRQIQHANRVDQLLDRAIAAHNKLRLPARRTSVRLQRCPARSPAWRTDARRPVQLAQLIQALATAAFAPGRRDLLHPNGPWPTTPQNDMKIVEGSSFNQANA
jgi:hypothetical protein